MSSPPSMGRRRSPSVVVVLALGLLTPVSADAVDLYGMGGMGINGWFMSVGLGGRPHQSVGVGITGRVHLKVGRFFRAQVGLIQGRFTEDDESQLKRNLIFGAVEAVHHFTERMYLTVGLRLGGDHVDLIETLEPLGPDTRRVRDVDRWFFLWEPFLTLGLRLAQKYHFELESGPAFSLVDGQVEVSYVVTFGIFFRMGGRG